MEETGCDAVMIGRAALGNPWIFSIKGRPRTLGPIVLGALEHLELMEEHLPVERMLGLIKNQIGRYFKNLKGSSKLRQAVHSTDSFIILKQLLTAASNGLNL